MINSEKIAFSASEREPCNKIPTRFDLFPASHFEKKPAFLSLEQKPKRGQR